MDDNNKYIDLQIEGTGIKIEDTARFEESYYSYEYVRAFCALNSIIKESSSNKENKNKDESYNIIAFVGTRGTGKSSAMQSFANALENIHRFSVNSGALSKVLKDLTDCYFHTLPSIDGSLLETKEDIFKITLGQMYGKLVELNHDKPVSQNSERMLEYKKREVQKSFQNLYRSACRMDQTEGNIEDSTIESLRILSNSLTLRKDFKKFVDLYLDLICEMDPDAKENQRKKQFLVISIDDLDMNIRNGYEMLEKIHRYLMVPGVIILMTMDFIQLKMLCEAAFYELIPKVNKILIASQGHISKLATDYTDKVIPIDSRIYMPYFKGTSNIRISNSYDEKKTSTPLLLKDYFFLELYKKSGMRFDHRGEKWHFYIPETMRGTVNFYLMLDQLDYLNKQDGKIREWNINDWTTFESNYTYLIGDIHHRMAAEKLNTVQFQLFTKWIDNTQFERSCMTVVKYISDLAKTGKDDNTEKLKGFRKDYLAFEYSYGELLRSIYLWGRATEANKQMVHCLLAIMTAQMTRSYYRMLQYDLGSQGIKKKEPNPYRKKLRYILNGSMLGSWSNRMLPEFDAVNADAFVSSVGALRNVLVSRIMFKFDISKIKGYTSLEISNRSNNLMEECKKIFRTMEFFALFFTDKIYKNTPTMEWKLGKLSDKEAFLVDDKKIMQGLPLPLFNALASGDIRTVFFETGNPSFNMYGFMSNLFDWEEESKNIENSLYACLFLNDDEKVEEKEKDENYLKQRDLFLKKIGIREEMNKWREKSAGFVLPFYSIDITYNILKRMRQDRYGQFMPSQNAAGIYKYFVGTLDKMAERLKETDKNYGILSSDYVKGKGISPAFAFRFEECPFVQWAKAPEKYLVSNFSSMFAEMLNSLVTAKNSDLMNFMNLRIEDEMVD